MHKEKASAPANFSYWGCNPAIGSIKNAHPTLVHECISLDEFEKMCFDVCANDTVRFDHGAGFRINIVPRSAHLRLQPALQRSEQIRQAFAVAVRTFDALELW